MKLDPNKTAMLTLDCQMGIFGIVPCSDAVIPIAPRPSSLPGGFVYFSQS
jgi:hypothetical protein